MQVVNTKTSKSLKAVHNAKYIYMKTDNVMRKIIQNKVSYEIKFQNTFTQRTSELLHFFFVVLDFIN